MLYRPFHCATLPLRPYTLSIPAANARVPRLSTLSSEEYNGHSKDGEDRACNGLSYETAKSTFGNNKNRDSCKEKTNEKEKIDFANHPFILTDVVRNWPAFGSTEWTIEGLAERYGDVVFRAEALDWPLRTYVEYMRDNCDESPLYLFDCRFGEKMRVDEDGDEDDKKVEEYGFTRVNGNSDACGRKQKRRQEVQGCGQDDGNAGDDDDDDVNYVRDTEHKPPFWTPECFADNLFDVWEPAERPDSRWLIVGPEGSGSTFHVDPNGTR